MRIVILTEYLLPIRNEFAWQIRQEARLLASLGHQVTIICPQLYGIHHRYDDIYHIPAVPLPGSSGYSLVFPGFHQATRIFAQTDVIHAHQPFALGRFGQSIAARRNIPFIFTRHSYRFDDNQLWQKFLDNCQAIIINKTDPQAQLESLLADKPIFYLSDETDVKRADQLVSIYQLTKRFVSGKD